MLSGPICAMVWEGREVVKTGRSMPSRIPCTELQNTNITIVILGATNPLASAPGTIRGDYAIVSLQFLLKLLPNADLFFHTQDVGRNVCHGSDAVESAKKEIALWFGESDIVKYEQAQFGWIYEKP